MSFEEYRQPWETGPHWELKREFLEQYKNDFPEDRLLCLAQAYSNIELLHCSYPAPVMVQIHELSKPLKGNKRFRRNQVPKNESPQNQKGKRKFEDSNTSSKQKYKFIKFCSSSGTSTVKPDNTNILKSSVSGNSKQSESIVESGHSNNELKISTVANSNLDETLIVPPDDSKDKTQLNTSTDHNLNCLIAFAKKLKTSNLDHNNALCVIKNASLSPSIFKDIELEFKVIPEPSHPHQLHLFICDLLINNVSIARGKGASKKKAKTEAAECGLKYLFNLLEPNKSSDTNAIDKPSIFKKTDSEIVMDGLNLNGQNDPNHGAERNNSEDKHFVQMSKQIKKTSDTEKCTFILNKKLFDNSIQKQILLYDRSELFESIEQSPSLILNYSLSQCRKSYNYNMIPTQFGYIAEILLNKDILGTGSGPSQAVAKAEASASALKFLKKEVYTIKVKKGNDVDHGLVIKRSDMLGSPKTINMVSEENVGCKMMKMMGWTGGGIGKKKGITEPIEVNNRVLGTGLGYGDEKSQLCLRTLLDNVKSILKDFAESSSTQTLIFSADFFKAERKKIHEIAGNLHLHSNSYGKNELRQLHVRRKITVAELLNILVEAGGSSSQYELVDLSG